MKQLFRLNLSTQTCIFITLAFFGCTDKTTDCTVYLKIDGKYEVVFHDNRIGLAATSNSEFNRIIQTNIKSDNVHKHHVPYEIQRVDYISSMTIDHNSDSIHRIYNINSTLSVDSIIFNGSLNFFKKRGVNHSVAGHSNHKVTEIINNKDTLSWMVTTNLNYNLSGNVNGKSNDFIVYYILEEELSNNYISDILKAITNRN